MADDRKSPAQVARERKAAEQAEAAKQQDGDAQAQTGSDAGNAEAQAPAEPEAQPPAVAEPAAPAEEAPVAEGQEKYSRQDILDNSLSRYGHGMLVTAGALSTLEGDEFTDAEVEAALKDFVDKPLDPGQPENLDEPRTDEAEETES